MRIQCYQPGWEEIGFRSMMGMLQGLRDTQTGLLWTLGLLQALEDLPDQESIAVLAGFLGNVLPEKWLGALGGRLDELLRMLIRKTERAYMLSTGEMMAPKGQVLYMRRQMTQMIALYGAKKFVKTLLQALSMPHRLRKNDATQGAAAYTYMVTQRFDELRRMIWCGYSPVCRVQRKAGRRKTGSRFARWSMEKNQRKSCR